MKKSRRIDFGSASNRNNVGRIRFGKKRKETNDRGDG
jgi:hypothetical protein